MQTWKKPKGRCGPCWETTPANTKLFQSSKYLTIVNKAVKMKSRTLRELKFEQFIKFLKPNTYRNIRATATFLLSIFHCKRFTVVETNAKINRLFLYSKTNIFVTSSEYISTLPSDEWDDRRCTQTTRNWGHSYVLSKDIQRIYSPGILQGICPGNLLEGIPPGNLPREWSRGNSQGMLRNCWTRPVSWDVPWTLVNWRHQ